MHRDTGRAVKLDVQRLDSRRKTWNVIILGAFFSVLVAVLAVINGELGLSNVYLVSTSTRTDRRKANDLVDRVRDDSARRGWRLFFGRSLGSDSDHDTRMYSSVCYIVRGCMYEPMPGKATRIKSFRRRLFVFRHRGDAHLLDMISTGVVRRLVLLKTGIHRSQPYHHGSGSRFKSPVVAGLKYVLPASRVRETEQTIRSSSAIYI